ncbi:MAG: hypothetical protein JO019_04255 [Candidatus Kaiserbacteria bacterium]|nr:hypothetical protein [Candidatus Kaiserbacteria bacterium]
MMRQRPVSARSRAASAFSYLSSEVRGLQAAAYVLAAAALFSSLLALLRDHLLAHAFGASTALDLYYAAFRIPDFIFVATGALVSVYILIPEFARRSDAEQRQYMDTILAGFSLLAILLCALAYLTAPMVLKRLFSEFSAEGYLPMLTIMTRIMLLQPILLGISNILAAVTQSRHRYLLYAVTGLFYNAGMIAGVVFFYPVMGLPGLALGVVIGALLHAAIQIPSIVSDGFLHSLPKIHDARAFIETMLVSVPRALALSMSEIAENVLIVIAGALAPGSIAVFTFAYNLQSVPLSVIGASYSVAAFPTLAQALSRGARDEFVEHVALASRYVLFWSLPASALVLVLRAQIIRVILGSGAFNWEDTRLTAAAFALFGLSLAAQGLTLLIVRAYYAAGRTFVPFIVAGATAIATIAFSFIGLFTLTNHAYLDVLSTFLRVQGITGSNVLVLSASYSIASILGTLVLIAHFEFRFGGYMKQIARAALQGALAAAATGVAAYVFLDLASSFVVSSTALSLFIQGAAAGVCGILVGASTYRLLGSREFSETYASLHGRLARRRTAAVTVASSAEDPGTPTGI